MNYVISGLSPDPFRQFFGLSDDELLARGVTPYVADKPMSFPDRIELRDVDVGERVLLLNHISMPLPTPYRASHAIFVKDGAEIPCEAENSIPDALRRRILSLRGFTDDGILLDAVVMDGREIEKGIAHLFDHDDVAFIHAHNAAQGCYHARIDRL